MRPFSQRLSLTVCALLATCGATTPAYAQGWAESWFDNVTYTAPGGSRALLELRTGSAAFNPFRLRELESFSCPRE